MISVFAVVLVEMFFAMKGAGHVHSNEYDTLMGDVGRESVSDLGDGATDYSQLEAHGGSGNFPLEGLHQTDTEGRGRQEANNDRPTITTSSGLSKENADEQDEDDEIDGLDGLDPFADEVPINGQGSHLQLPLPRPRGHSRQPSTHIPLQNPQRHLLQCLLLEAGILFHSIFIGMALSVATGTSFVVLLIAISFHQTFEGFALGSRIASLIPDLFSPSSPRPWLMCLAYGTTTPLGQAIGLVLHNLYDPASTTGLLMVGITNAISSGLLLFAGLVELLAEDFLSEPSYETLKGRRRVEACISVACGALLMAFVGAFA